MSAPYYVWIARPSGYQEHIPCKTLDEAILRATEVPSQRHMMVRVIGDGYDAEYGLGGPRVCSDGLTEHERERVEAAGL